MGSGGGRMSRNPEGHRVLIYSHDTFGLGHLRRCRAIAHSLVEENKQLSVLILSGSPIIGSFDFRARVDFVRIPGVIKLRNGEYTSLNLHIDIEQMLAMRASIIQHTADIFQPDIFIVDKEPLGLRGEVEETLGMLKERGTRLVLGLRDVQRECFTVLKGLFQFSGVALQTLAIAGHPGTCHRRAFGRGRFRDTGNRDCGNQHQ